MISQFRAFSKSPIAVVLFVLLLISFAVFGISDVFTGGATRDTVVQAGGRTISGAQFKQTFDNYKAQLTQQNQGRPVTTEEAVANGVDRNLVESLAYSESLAELVSRLGLRASDNQVVAEIRKATAFFDPISGRFDRPTYQQKLQENGLTEAQFEQMLRDDIAQTHLISGLAAGLRPPRTYAAALGVFNSEGRNVQWFAVSPRMAAPPAVPTDAQLTAYIKANAARFTKPEMRQLTLVQFSAAQAMQAVPVDPAEVQKRFAFERDSLTVPETRSLVVIPVKDAAAGAAVAARLRAGEQPAAVARALGIQPVTYTNSPKTGVPDRPVADAAFAMKAGEVRGPVQGALGLAVIKIEAITPGRVPTLEEVRPRIEEQVRRDAALERVYAQVQKYEDARTGGANMADAAKAAAVSPTVLPEPISAQGASLSGQSINLPPQVLQAAFELAQGAESDVINLAEGEYFAVRAERVVPPALVTLAEARGPATQAYMFEELRKSMTAKAEELAARVRKGEAVTTVAASVGAPVAREPNLQRGATGKPVTANTMSALFAAKPGETIVVPDDQVGVIVAKLEGIVTGPPVELARAVEGQREGLRNNVFSDIGFAVRNAARDRIKPTIDQARARTAIGVEPAAPEGNATVPAPGTKQ